MATPIQTRADDLSQALWTLHWPHKRREVIQKALDQEREDGRREARLEAKRATKRKPRRKEGAP